MHDKIKQLGHWVGFVGGIVAILATFGGGVNVVDGKASASDVTAVEQRLTVDEQQITVNATHYADIDSRLDRIENKLDRALERSADRANTPQAQAGRKN